MSDGTGSGSMPNVAAPSLVGQVLDGRYRIFKKLGEGGMGEVYAAEHMHIDKKYAVKLLKPEIVSNQEAVTRFQQEARSSSSIKHRNIIAIDDFGKLPDNRIYMCMELLEGQALNDLIQSPQPVERLLNILIQTGHGLAAAHARHIVHRDMKPENIFVTMNSGEDVPKILDFGIAKVAGNDGQNNLTRTGTIFGTPFYMAPEQALGNPVDARTDIYAMGVIMYEVFAGSLPFQGESFMGILTQHITSEPEPVSQRAAKAGRPLPAGLADVIMRCLSKNPAQRFNTMDELVNALIGIYRSIAGAGMSTYMEAFPGSPGRTPGPMTAAHGTPSAAMSSTVGVSGPPPGVMASGGHAFVPAMPPPSGSAPAMGAPPSASASGLYDPSAGSNVAPKKKSSMGLVIAIVAVLAVGGGVAAFVVLNKDDTGQGSGAGTGSGGSGSGPVADNGSNKAGSGTTTTTGGGSGTTTTNTGGGSATKMSGGGSDSGSGAGAGTGSGGGGIGGAANNAGGGSDVATNGSGAGSDSGSATPPPAVDGGAEAPKTVQVTLLATNKLKNFEVIVDGSVVKPVDITGDHVVEVPEGGEVKVLIKAKGFQDKELTISSQKSFVQFDLSRPPTKNPKDNPNTQNGNSGNTQNTNTQTTPKCTGTPQDLSKALAPYCRKKFCDTHTDARSQALCDAD